MSNGSPSRRCCAATAACVALLMLAAPGTSHAEEREPEPPKRVCEGHGPWISPSGGVLAVARSEDDPKHVDEHGSANRVLRVWFRNMDTGVETKAQATGQPVSWIDATTLLLDSRKHVNALSGQVVGEGAPATPEGLYTPGRATLAGGKTLVYIGRTFTLKEQTSPPADRGPSLYVVRRGSAPVAAESRFPVNVRTYGWIAPAPDGRHALIGWGFMRSGNVPNFRVAILDADAPRLRFVDDAPGLSYQARRVGGAGGARTAAWDRESRIAAYVINRGGGYVDLQAVLRASAKPVLLTVDGLPKWQPAVDPMGARVAFWRSASHEDDAPARLVVRHLHADREETYALPAASGTDSFDALHWMPDGRAVIYAHGDTVYLQRVGAPPEVAPDAPLVARRVSQVDRIVAALTSDSGERIKWGLEKAGDHDDPRLVPPLRRLLAGVDVYVRPWDVFRLLVRSRAASALPEILARLETLGGMAFQHLARWRPPAAKPVLETMAANAASESSRAWARIALIAYAKDVDFTELEALVESASGSERSTIARALGTLRRPESVDLLIRLVKDTTRLYTTYGGEIRVCDHAEESLVGLTGQCFRADAAKWKAWWTEEAQRVLPPRFARGENPGRKAYAQWMKEREDEHQGRMRDKLKDVLEDEDDK